MFLSFQQLQLKHAPAGRAGGCDLVLFPLYSVCLLLGPGGNQVEETEMVHTVTLWS